MATQHRWRAAFYKLVPSWLSTGDGEKVLFSLGLIADAFIERTRQSLTARFPRWTDAQGVTHLAGNTALAMLGAERGIVQGRAESTAGYTRRLREWRGARGHLVRGSAYALLRQVWAYFDGMRADTIDINGNRFAVAADGTESATHGESWVWDSSETRKALFWLELYPAAVDGIAEQPDFGSTLLWGGAFGVAGYTVGISGLTPGDAQTLQRLFSGEHPWHPAGTLPMWCIVNLDGTAQTPDGTWRKWYKIVAGVAVEARYSGWRYVALAAALKDYLGDGSLFPADVTIVPGGAFTTASGDGNGASWGAVTLPGGSTYTGDASNAAAWGVVRLPDDGDDPA